MIEADKSEQLTKFSRQAADLCSVYLYKEGLFLRAYNEGAYGFVHQVMACKPIRRFVKAIGDDRIVCGAPQTTVAKLPAFIQAEQIDAVIWRLPLSKPVDLAQYHAWREGLPLIAKEEASQVKTANPMQQIMDRLMQFNVATSTPVAALNLVADLQRQWLDNISPERLQAVTD